MRNMIQIHLERSNAAVSNLEVTLTIGYCAHRLLRNPFACHRLEPWNSQESHDPLGLVVASGKAYLTQWDLPCESSPALCTQQSAICFQVFFFFYFSLLPSSPTSMQLHPPVDRTLLFDFWVVGWDLCNFHFRSGARTFHWSNSDSKGHIQFLAWKVILPLNIL